MKKLLLFAVVVMALPTVLKAQDRATTWDEYNYLKQGNYGLVLPGHALKASNISETITYALGTRQASVWELYRDAQSTPCAIVVIVTTSDGRICFPVPDIGSDSSMWKSYRDNLSNWATDFNVVNAVAYILGKYAASH